MAQITYPYKKWLYPEDEETNPIEFKHDAVLNKLIARMEENKIVLENLFSKYPGILHDYNRFLDQNPKYNTIAIANNSAVPSHMLEDRIEKFGRFQKSLDEIKSFASRRDSYIDQNYVIRLHDSLYFGDPEFRFKAKYRFRNEQDGVIQTPYFKPTIGENVSYEMMNLLSNTDFVWNNMHAVKQSTLLHLGLSRIQPFMDGNKKTAQLLQNFYLMKAGFPDIVLPDKAMNNYLNAVKLGILYRDATPLAELVSNCILHEQLDTFEFIKSDLCKDNADECKDLNEIESNISATKDSIHTIPVYILEKDMNNGSEQNVEKFNPTAEENSVCTTSALKNYAHDTNTEME